jgi:hypothetical protein
MTRPISSIAHYRYGGNISLLGIRCKKKGGLNGIFYRLGGKNRPPYPDAAAEWLRD